MKKMQIKFRSLALALFCLTLIVAHSCKKDEAQQLTVTDINGNVYHTTKIGTQTWMVGNLRTSRLNDGTSIQLVTDANIWQGLKTPARCWYNNDSASNNADYGVLYNWYTVNTGKLAPVGWHVATLADWKTLVDYLIEADLGNLENPAMGSYSKDYVAYYLKEYGTAHWTNNSTVGINKNFTGFNALPGGYRSYIGPYNGLKKEGHWWTSTNLDTNNAYTFLLYDYSKVDHSTSLDKKNGFSVLLVKD